MTAEFVHLHVHTAYSLLDGAIKLSDLFDKAERDGQTAVAITDHGNLHGVVQFAYQAKNHNIKPVIGCEVYLAHGSRHDKSNEQPRAYHQVLLCENEAGWRNLLQIINTAHLEGKTSGLFGRPRADRELLEKHSEGLVCLSSCLSGMVPRTLLELGYDKALAMADWYRQVFPGRFYIEIQRNGLEDQEKANVDLLKIARELELPVVATCDAHYLDREHARSHEILLCIQTGATMNDPKRFKFSSDQIYFRTRAEMAETFGDLPAALRNTLEVAERCTFVPQFGAAVFPAYQTPRGEDSISTFTKAARSGLLRRLKPLRESHDEQRDGPWMQVEKIYAERLEIEIDLITRKGFADYFLIVQDFIGWARDHGIPVGPGRGSAAGALVSYALGITNIDPLRYNLLFERFLNPERQDNPDIDVDFCAERRDEVIRYVSEKYGEAHVSQIATFGSMKARQVVRDVGRAMGYSFGEVDSIAKLIPDDLNMTLAKAEKTPDVERLLKDAEWARELWFHARALEGLPRHVSTHAAGVVISRQPLGECVPLMLDKDANVVCQFDKNDVETAGLIKFDFLGLKTLTVIDKTLRMIREVHGIDIDMDRIPLDDPEAYALLGRGLSTGVFQFESPGMRDLLVRLKPDRIEDLTAINALYRPGPIGSGMIDDFIARKKGEQKVVYDLDILGKILESTYGMMVYQEQVQQVAHVVGGMSLGEADLMRRAMAKKKIDKMAAFKVKFLEGAARQHLARNAVEKIWDMMEKFAEYGFNKSHSAAYALVAYQTAYLKAHYSSAFMAALMTMEKNDSDKIMAKIAECRDLGIKVLPPDVNESGREFTINKKGQIRFGLEAVKNVGEGAVLSMIEARQKDGPFKGLYDFCERIDVRKANKRVVESLVKCGAFDSLEPHRAALLAAVEGAMDQAVRRQTDRDSGQTSLFGMLEAKNPTAAAPALPNVPEWSHDELLRFEKEALGFFITGHPLDDYRLLIDRFANADSETLRDATAAREVRIAAVFTALDKKMTKTGKPMAMGMAEDQKAPFRVTLFAEALEKSAALLENLEQPALLFGKIDLRDGGNGLLVEKAIPLVKAPEVCSNEVHFNLRTVGLSKGQLQRLAECIHRHPGSCRGVIHLEIPDRSEATFVLPNRLGLSPSDDLVEEVRAIFGPGVVNFQ
ncbi:MAG: DNA polymerase III subunit alpha [Myxococcales bacterium]|nr:DNA polymerase III subunit alpha [Myxococcales bacterium]